MRRRLLLLLLLGRGRAALVSTERRAPSTASRTDGSTAATYPLLLATECGVLRLERGRARWEPSRAGCELGVQGGHPPRLVCVCARAEDAAELELHRVWVGARLSGVALSGGRPLTHGDIVASGVVTAATPPNFRHQWQCWCGKDGGETLSAGLTEPLQTRLPTACAAQHSTVSY